MTPSKKPHIWKPFTLSSSSEDIIKITHGEGIWLYTDQGHKLLDAISSWWVNIHGHCQKDIAKSISQQTKTLEHVIFAGFSHEPAEKLVYELSTLLPSLLNVFFFSDNGSTAVEIALKMAIQYWKNISKQRSRFICFTGSYHGDTFGSMSVTERGVFTQAFNDYLFEVEFSDIPLIWHNHRTDEEENEIIAKIEHKLHTSPNKYAGILIEPLVQGAGGIRMHHINFLKKIAALSKKYGILLLCDEVMTGFGRTGSWFASTKADIIPDIMMLSKGLSGGFLPLALTVCQEYIYETFQNTSPDKTFWHGHSFTGNPLGCAAAITSMQLLKKNCEQFQNIENIYYKYGQPLKTHPLVKKWRTCGTIMAMDIETHEGDTYFNSISQIIRTKGLKKGLLLRPLGNVLYIMPPYCITETEIKWIIHTLKLILDEIHQGNYL